MPLKYSKDFFFKHSHATPPKKGIIQRIKGMREEIICGSHEIPQASIYWSVIDEGPPAAVPWNSPVIHRLSLGPRHASLRLLPTSDWAWQGTKASPFPGDSRLFQQPALAQGLLPALLNGLTLHCGPGRSTQPSSLLSFILISVSCSLSLFWLPPHILSQRQFSNKIFAHLILSWNLPLGGPRLMHNCRWKISTNIWKITSRQRSSSYCKQCDPKLSGTESW